MPTSSPRDETYFAGAYWGARQESAEDCARRMEVLFAALAGVDSSLSHWFQQGRSRKDALKRPIEARREELEKLVLRGRDKAFADLGFSIAGWNGVTDDYDACGFHFTCGSYAKAVGNACVFTLPSRGPNADRLLTASVLGGLVRGMALAWEPDSAVAMSSPHLQMVDKGEPSAVWIGWVTYLPAARGKVPPLPAPVRVEPVEDKGTLIVLTPERFTVSNPEHVALAARVQGLLEQAGLFRPLSPPATSR